MNKELPLVWRFAIGVLSVVLLAVLLVVLITKPYAADGVPMTAEFGRAGQGLGKTSPVKIRGMQVGRVEKVTLEDDGRALIALRIDEGVRIPDTVVASLEPASVFGPKFINLLPGEHETTGPFLPAGTRITRTADPRDLNDLLNDANVTLAALDPADLAIIVDSLAQGLGGQGAKLRETVDSVEELVRVAHENRKNAKDFLADLARLARIQGAGDDIGTIVADANAVIDTAADGQGRLRGFANGVRDVSAITAGGFDHHAAGLGAGFRSGERAVNVIAAQLGLAGTSIRTINELLPIYRKVSWAPAGGDQRMLGVKVLIPLNPCAILLGLPACEQWAKTLPGVKAAQKKKGGS